MHRVIPCTPEVIQERIGAEDDKISRYRHSYSAVWLVLVKGAEGPSTWGVLTRGVRETLYGTRYDRLFLLEIDRSRCHELQVAREVPLRRRTT
jgi:hypothetical protein